MLQKYVYTILQIADWPDLNESFKSVPKPKFIAFTAADICLKTNL